MIKLPSLRAASWLLLPLLVTGCGTKSEEDSFQGTGAFALTITAADGTPTEHHVATQPKLVLRRGKYGGTDLVLDRSCALRSVGGNITGTYACRVVSPAGPMALQLQSGTWKITEQEIAYSSDGCQLHRYALVVDATGSIQNHSGATVTLHFEGLRNLQVCPQRDDGVYASTPWIWTEDPYTSDGGWGYGYDWDDDGDWDYGGGSGGDWGGDDGDWGDSGGWDDGGDWGGDDGGDWGDGGDGGGGDGGGGGGDGDWATGHTSKSQKARGAHPGKTSAGQITRKVQ